LHAEQNAIIQAALHGVNIKDAILYCTHYPCSLCAKMLINGGIKKVIYTNGYPDELAYNLMKEAGLETVQFLRKE
jgi:dCMP deaminase